MFTRVKAALAACGLEDQYLPVFQDLEMDDGVVALCLENPGDLSPLIPGLASRLKFVNKFRKIQEAQVTQASSTADLLLTAKAYYNAEMENLFKANNETVCFEQRTLDKHHERIKKSACKHTADNHPEPGSFTSAMQQQFEDQCDEIYKAKYVEKNLMRRPTVHPAIGIDLGTSNSCVAVYIKGRVEVIHNESGNFTTPSCVSVQNDGKVVAGEAAKELCHRYPRNTIFDAKRLIGRPFKDPNVQKSMKSWPFCVFDCNGQPKIRVDNVRQDDELDNEMEEDGAHCTRSTKRRHLESLKTFHPEEISAHVLKKMKTIAEAYLGTTVEAAVITVPALFNDSQRQATKDAGAIAGLKVLRIINEPTCAAIAYQLHRLDDLQRNVLVFDLGGGTFDVAVLKIRGGDVNVAAVHGDNYLGGVTFDEAMVAYCIKWFEKTYGVDLTRGQHSIRPEERAQASNRLRLLLNECERQKKVLSTFEKTYVCVHGIDTDHPRYKMDVPFTRKLFESVNKPHFDKTMEIVEEALKEAQMRKEEVNDVVLVGGSTRIPKVQQMLSTFFGEKALKLVNSIHPEHAVAIGAAIQACILNGSEDVQRFTGEYGLTLSDVTPLSIGLEDGKTEKMIVWIGKNTPVPCRSTKSWFPISDNQNSIFFKIFEGENNTASENKLLGEFELVGIPLNKAWKEEVKVTMTISEEGILFITAKCESNGVSTDLTINAYKQRLTQRDIETAAVRNFN